MGWAQRSGTFVRSCAYRARGKCTQIRAHSKRETCVGRNAGLAPIADVRFVHALHMLWLLVLSQIAWSGKQLINTFGSNRLYSVFRSKDLRQVRKART